MPEILEMRVVDGEVWARIDMPSGEKCVTLWTEAEKEEVLEREREVCLRAIEQTNRELRQTGII